MHDIDAATLQHQQITSLELMERAAQAVAQFVREHYAVTTRVMVFAGPGGNGGDALAVARILSLGGYEVTVYLFNTAGKLSADCYSERERLSEAEGLTFVEVTQQFEPPVLEADTLVVDGLFGTGQKRPLGSGFAQLVQLINASPAEVVAIDVPSGLRCEDNSHNNRAHVVRATHTLTFQLPKLAFLLPDCQPFLGTLHTLDIRLSKDAIDALGTPYQLSSPSDFAPMLRPRPAFGHKGTFGHALLVAGASGMAGAAILCARAALRSGVGKVTVHTPRCNRVILQTAVPEAVLSLDESEDLFSTPLSTEGYAAAAIGPGLGTEHATAVALVELVRSARVPLVVDADGINLLAAHKDWLALLPAGSILTPHPAELQRLTRCSADSFATLTAARETAAARHLYVVLKGHRTAVCTPEGHVYFNPTGNSGMATAGSGDVLTGLITSLLAQGYDAATACRLGVYLHGAAGDFAAAALSEEAVTASDLIDHLPQAFLQLKQ